MTNHNLDPVDLFLVFANLFKPPNVEVGQWIQILYNTRLQRCKSAKQTGRV